MKTENTTNAMVATIAGTLTSSPLRRAGFLIPCSTTGVDALSSLDDCAVCVAAFESVEGSGDSLLSFAMGTARILAIAIRARRVLYD